MLFIVHQVLPTLLAYATWRLKVARMANTTSAEVKAFLQRESRRNLGPSVTTSMSVVTTTWNSSTAHRGHRTTREKWTVKWFCTVACLTIVVVCSHPILKSPRLHNTVNSSTTLTVPSTSVGINVAIVCKWEVTIQVLKHKFSGQQQKCCNPSCSWSRQSWPSTF